MTNWAALEKLDETDFIPIHIDRIYIAGPMTGLPDCNYPLFNRVAKVLEAAGHSVQNPAANSAPKPETWENWLRLALRQMLGCDAVATLPGWEKSRGARLEVRTARALSMPVLPWTYWALNGKCGEIMRKPK